MCVFSGPTSWAELGENTWNPKSLAGYLWNTAHLRNAATEEKFSKKSKTIKSSKMKILWTLTHSCPSSDPVTKGSDPKEWPNGDLRDSVFKF